MKVLYKMKLKRICTLFISIICVIPFSSANAASEDTVAPTTVNAEITPMGAGEWDYLGSSTFVNSSAIAKSSGGDFLVCLESGPSGYYNLYEYDPDNADDKVGYVYLYPGACGAFRSIGGFVDGDNQRAEFYVYKAWGGTATVSFYD
ncbi:MAG: hypothetical protein ACQEXQ_26600 [Bacillota bacterium]